MYLPPLVGHIFEIDRGIVQRALLYSMHGITETYDLIYTAGGSTGDLGSPWVVPKFKLH